jgi:hydroxymethylglutaryl-CoA reductase (NADPH)
MQVPEFLLRRLYVRGSLRNTDGGFQFELRNSLGSGYAEQVLPLAIDDGEVPVNRARFIVDGKATPFADVSAANPMTLALESSVTVAVDGKQLDPGKHRIAMGFVVTGMGEMRFEVTDLIEGGEPPDAA